MRKPMNTFKRALLVIHGYTCYICDRLWCVNDLKQAKEKHIGVLVQHFPDMDAAMDE
jgi:hypothetical protein